MKNFFAKKTIKILTGVIVFVLFGFNAVKATHIPYQWDDNLSAKENFKRAGHSEMYESFLNENAGNNDKKFNQNTYESEVMKMLNKKQQLINIKNNESSKDLVYTLLQPLPTNSGEDLKTNVTLKQYLTWAYKFALALTGFLAVMMIVIGGVEWIISGASESMRSEAKKHINGAITGLIMALVAYLVLYTINPSLVNFEDNWFFKPRGANSGTVNGGTGDSGKNVITNVYDKNENGGGTVKHTANSTYKKQDGEFSYDVKVTKEAIEYKDGNYKYKTTEDYTDKDQNKHIIINTRDKNGNNVFSGEIIDYGNNGGIKYYKNNQEVKQSEFNK